MKQQDLLGIIMAMGITVIAVGIAFAGNTFSETTSSVNNSISSPSTSVHGFGAITNVDGESIEFEFIPGNEINLDEHEFVRAKITYTGYLQQMGIVTLNVFSVNTGESVKKSEITLRLFDENIWVTDVMHRFDKQNFIDNPDLIGTYLLRVNTEHGTFSGKTPFTVTMPSVKPIVETVPSVKPIVETVPNVISSFSAIPISDNDSENNQVKITIDPDSFELSDFEPFFKEKMGKTFLTKILKEYYAKNISKDDFVHLKSFDDLDCSITMIQTPNGEEIQIQCNFKLKQ